MDPFLPGEIPVMVLRFLAANKCESSALSLIEELPLLKGYVPSKPPKVSNADYLKHLARSTVNPGLKDVLTDYGNSKILADEILEENENLLQTFSLATDSLLSKIKALQRLLKTSKIPDLKSHEATRTRSSRDVDNESKSKVYQVEQDTNTDEHYECPRCLTSRLERENKSTVENGCQTEEYTAVQFGLQNDIPLIFYNTLLGDGGLQQKIAQTINEHIRDPQDDKNEDVVQKISSKTESEIDKFLVELLQDIPEDSNSAQSCLGVQNTDNSNAHEPSLHDIESNLSLSTIFRDAEILLGNTAITAHRTEIAPPPKVQSSAFQTEDRRTSETSPNFSNPPDSSSCTGSRRTANSDSSSIKSTPKSNRSSAVKRITPTPLSSANINPVFNTSVVVEKPANPETRSGPKVSVITVNAEPPPWQKLNRKSITPKIPGVIVPKPSSKVRVVNKLNDNLLNFVHRQSITAKPDATETAKDQINPSSLHKRKKGTPMKLTPEKANNMDLNFMHVYHESNNKPAATPSPSTGGTTKVNTDSSVKSTPTPPSPSTSSSNQSEANNVVTNSHSLVLENENSSQVDVTPMQLQPSGMFTASELKTISPNALQRLIASANKVGETAPGAAFNKKKKSFSTPRKRKHVRSLTFATPPTLKSGTPGSVPVVGASASQKRKSSEDFFSAEFRSKKRLSWPEHDVMNKEKGKKRYDLNNAGDSLTTPALDQPEPTKDEDTSLQMPVTATTSSKTDASVPKSSMPIILEESMSESQTNETHAHITSCVGENPTWNPASKPLTFISVPTTMSDGRVQYHYLQVSDDMQNFYPVQFVTGDSSEPLAHIVPQTHTLPTEPLSTPFAPEHNANAPSPHPRSLPSKPPPNEPPSPSLPPKSYSEVPPQTKPPLPAEQIPAKTSPCVPPPPPFQPTNPPQPIGNETTLTAIPSASSQEYPTQTSSLVTIVPLATTFHSPTTIQHHHHQDETGTPTPPGSSDTSVVVETPTEITPAVSSESKTKSYKKREPAHKTPPSPPKRQNVERRRKSARNSDVQRQEDVQETVKEFDGPGCAAPNKFASKSPAGSLESQKSVAPNKDLSESPLKNQPQKKGRDKPQPHAAPKKPKGTINLKDLFGGSPNKVKARSLRSNKDSKRLAEIAAAQAVAAEAVPLGTPTPRRSPRKHPLKTPVITSSPIRKVSPNVDVDPFYTGSRPLIQNSSVGVSKLHPSSYQTESNSNSNSISFSIVPAPLGFPEPTPIKNFMESGFLNITSEIGVRSPLITPLKSLPPILNETQFTLPPTPRVIEDHDSNSNSTHSIKLTYDGGLYPANLLTSTPLKPGIPRTPGKGSSSGSNNSHSPISTEQQVGQGIQTQQKLPVSEEQIIHPIDLSSPQHGEKSDGEISTSSDSNEGDNVSKRKCMEKQMRPQHQPNPNTNFKDQFSTQKRFEPLTPNSTPGDLVRPQPNSQLHFRNQIGQQQTSSTSNNRSQVHAQKPSYHDQLNPPQKSSRDRRSKGHAHEVHRGAVHAQDYATLKEVLQQQQMASYGQGPSAQQRFPRQISNNSVLNQRSNVISSKLTTTQPHTSNVMSEPHPCVPVAISSNNPLTPGISFHVGSRKKELTMSEHETLYSLVQMRSGVIGGRMNENTTPASNPGTQKSSDEPKNPHLGLLQNKNLGQLINLIHRKHKVPKPP